MLDRFVLVALAESAKDADRIARYESSAEAIADRIQSTPGSVRNALQRLRERGLIVPMLAKVHRGHAQQWHLVKLTEAHRRSVWEASPPSDAIANGKRHPRVTHKPVDNS